MARAALAVANTGFGRGIARAVSTRSTTNSNGDGPAVEYSEQRTDTNTRAARKRAFIREKTRSFVDVRRVLVKAGDGGNGSVTWRRQPGERRFKPMGADGGPGGDVVFVASPRLSTLDHVTTTVKAGRGGHGGGRGCLGNRGADAVVEVPCGTMVWVDNSPQLRRHKKGVCCTTMCREVSFCNVT